jgi:hypothetical protein
MKKKEMVAVLRKGADKAAIQELMRKLTENPSRRGLDAYRYCGTVKFKEDGLGLQKRLRDEWE